MHLHCERKCQRRVRFAKRMTKDGLIKDQTYEQAVLKNPPKFAVQADHLAAELS